MVLSWRSTIFRLAVIVVVTCWGWSLAEKRLLCSSEFGSLWYDYEGPLHHLSMAISPCYIGMREIKLNYSLITMFTIRRAGFHVSILFKNKQWMEFSEPVESCMDFRVCHILKGEMIQEVVPLRFRAYPGVELSGEYLILLRFNIVDDFDQELMVNLTITAYVNA